jgi:hypothetical protein
LEVDVGGLASEFPNDNPALHAGVIWVCLEPTGRPQPEGARSIEPTLAEPEPIEACAPCEPAELIEPPGPTPPVLDAVAEAIEASQPAELAEPAHAADAEQQVADSVEAATPKFDSLAPPEDDEVDPAAGPIVVEELEPIESSLEGDVANENREPVLAQSSVESAPERETTRPALTESVAELANDEQMAAPMESLVSGPETIPAAVESAAEVVAELDIAPAPTDTEVSVAESALAVPAPAVSEVVLVAPEGEWPAEEQNGEPDATALARAEASVTPVFEEVAANDTLPRDSTQLPPAPDDPYTVLVCMLADVAIGAGSAHVASLLPGLLFDGRLPEPLEADAGEALRAAGIWDGAEVAPGFVAVTRAWRAILRGTSDDFSACGESMLDEWASDLLARLLDAPAKAPTLRQELRSRGVAAFGLAA